MTSGRWPRPGAWEAPAPRRTRGALLLAAFAVTGVVVVGALAGVGPDETRELPPETPPPTLPVEPEEPPPAGFGQLADVPSAPLAPRAHPHAAWSGEELLVWSGAVAVDADGEPAVGDDGRYLVAEDGAAYDPTTDRWRPLPPAPIAGRVAAAVVWAGDRLLVWGGFARPDEPLGDGAAYLPDEDAWVPLPPAPIGERGQAVAAWTGDEVVVVGGTRVAGRAAPARAASARDAAAFDPDAARWRSLPPLPHGVWPLPGRFAAAWDGEALLVWGRDLAIYHPEEDAWERIRPPPTGLWSGVAVQAVTVGRGVVLFGLVVRAERSAYGLHFDATSGAFEAAPPLHRQAMTSRQRGVVAAADRIVVLLGPPANQALAWRPSEDAWTHLPPGLAARDGAALVWTGDALLVWGGSDGRSLRADGLAWSAASADATR